MNSAGPQPRGLNIAVTKRNYRQSAFDGYQQRWSPYSELKCLDCGHHWRSKGEGVTKIRDATTEEHAWLPGQH